MYIQNKAHADRAAQLLLWSGGYATLVKKRYMPKLAPHTHADLGPISGLYLFVYVHNLLPLYRVVMSDGNNIDY